MHEHRSTDPARLALRARPCTSSTFGLVPLLQVVLWRARPSRQAVLTDEGHVRRVVRGVAKAQRSGRFLALAAPECLQQLTSFVSHPSCHSSRGRSFPAARAPGDGSPTSSSALDVFCVASDAYSTPCGRGCLTARYGSGACGARRTGDAATVRVDVLCVPTRARDVFRRARVLRDPRRRDLVRARPSPGRRPAAPARPRTCPRARSTTCPPPRCTLRRCSVCSVFGAAGRGTATGR